MAYFKKNKGFKIVTRILFFLIIFVIIIAVVPQLRVMTVVKFNKQLHEYHSVQREQGVQINIPTGRITREKDWFPIMNVFHDEKGFSNKIKRDVELTILYNYGDFDSLFGTSLYYDSDSPYYGGYYGAYILKDNSNHNSFYGFDEKGNVIPEEFAQIPEYDQKYLALASIGSDWHKRVFKIEAGEILEDVNYAGYENWVRVDSSIYTNGPAHKRKKFQLGYLQYGNPLLNKEEEEDFKPANFHGRMYIRAFEKSRVTICLYIMAIDEGVLEDCDEKFLAKTIIKEK